MFAGYCYYVTKRFSWKSCVRYSFERNPCNIGKAHGNFNGRCAFHGRSCKAKRSCACSQLALHLVQGVRLAQATSEGVGKVFNFAQLNSDSMGPFSYGLTEQEMAASGGMTPNPAEVHSGIIAAMAPAWRLVHQHLTNKIYSLRANFNSPWYSEDYGTITARFDDAVALIEEADDSEPRYALRPYYVT